jgi:hypothetical protein
MWRAAVGAGAVVSLQAHPGHAPFSEGTKHFLSNPNHFGPALIFSLVVLAAAQLLQRRGERNFLRGIAGVIAVTAFLVS